MAISIIRDRVLVQILRDTAAVSRVSFGVPLFIGDTASSPRAASYANIDEVADEFATTDPEYLAALAFFAQQPQPRELIIGNKATEETYVEALAAIRAVNDTWFAVAVEENDMAAAAATALATAVSALPGLRQLHLRTNDADVLVGADDEDLASVMAAANFDQVRVVYHSLAATTYPEMAILGRVLPIPESRTTGPGSAAWHDQPIVGIPGDVFTTTQRAALEAKNAEYMCQVAGAVRCLGGKMAGGEWGDVMHGIAWLETRLAEDVYELIARAGNRRQKIPFTDEGIARVEGVIRDRLAKGVDIGLLVNDFTTSAPKREDTEFGDRTNRILKDLTFEANLAGAIKFAQITGVVTA